jgi:DNA replication protein DnaC
MAALQVHRGEPMLGERSTSQTSVRMQMLGTLLGPELVSEGRSAIFSGPPGRGKTHLAVAVAYRAIQNGFEAFFTSADELIGALSHGALAGRLETALEPHVHPHVLIIDELGYCASVKKTTVGHRMKP